MTHGPKITARSWGQIPPSWTHRDRWITEWMTIDDDRWFARIRQGTDPALPPVVMIHGLIVSGRYFQPVANIIDDRFDLYLPDLPGIGGASSKRIWSLASFATRLGFWMDAHDLRGAIIVGNSLGCQLATLLATRRPELVRSLVLVAPTLEPAITSVGQLLARGIRDIPRERASIWTVWIPDFFRTGVRRSVVGIREMFADDQLSRLPNVTRPAITVGGECDPIVSPAWVREMARRMPHGEAIIVPGAPHALNYSSPRDLVNAIERVVDRPMIDEEAAS